MISDRVQISTVALAAATLYSGGQPSDLVSLSDLKLELQLTETADDSWLAKQITRASASIMQFVNRPLVQQTYQDLVYFQKDPWPRAVQRRIAKRRFHGNRINITAGHKAAQSLGRSQRQHTRAGTHIQNMARTPLLQNAIQHDKTAAGGAMMTGAKSEGSRDFKADLVTAHRRAVMGTMNHKPPPAHGHKPVQRSGNPVFLLDRPEGQAFGNSLAQGIGDQLPKGCLIGRIIEIDLNHPVFGHPCGGVGLNFKNGNGSFILIENFEKEIGNAIGCLLVTAKAHHMCGRILNHASLCKDNARLSR